jgi:hypothetical protein
MYFRFQVLHRNRSRRVGLRITPVSQKGEVFALRQRRPSCSRGRDQLTMAMLVLSAGAAGAQDVAAHLVPS